MNQSYKIKIDQSVLDQAHKKDKNVLTLSISTTGGGCCPTFETAEVNLIKPDDTEPYDIFEQDNMTIYISKRARVIAKTLHFKLKKNLIGVTIQAEGLSLKKRDA
ncbi:hypothetical protein [Acetobacterium woodii]|uniref:hypothetical protein n=1 Tax=Acetobacterium woodii TaxID=33952 RepID=UPI0002E0EB0F|nr:hypothetical protein [Acetobacterium woodii]